MATCMESDVSVTSLFKELHEYDYIRFTWSDIHGIQRGVTVAKRNLKAFLENGVYTICSTNGMGVRTQFIVLKEVIETKYVNIKMKPRLGTAHPLPWAGAGEFKMGEVLCNSYWKNGQEMEACSVNIVTNQINRLQERGYKILSGFEIEFTVLKADTLKPVFDGTEFYSTLVFSESEKFALKLDHYLEAAGVDLECLHTEFGSGQFELTTRPQWGIKSADNVFMFKAAAKEIASQTGNQAIFMTRPGKTLGNNGLHLTFSLWDKEGKNIMVDDDGNMSKIGNYFIAGLCQHGAALTALCAPTVNCYRRFFCPWTPQTICWAQDNRMVTFRTKVYGEKGACIENRLPSSAANPYLVLAATIAAGLDGIDKKLELPPESNIDGNTGTMLPASLDEAIGALQKDTIIAETIGEMMLEWFVRLKRETELSELPNFKRDEFDEETIAKEFYLYSRLL